MEKTRHGIAGMVAAGVALGVGELLAGLFAAVPSPLAAVGGQVVDSSPPFVKDFAIEVFGTSDKAALAIGTAVIVLLLGWMTGVEAAKRRWVGPAVFSALGLLGVASAWNEPFAEPVQVIAATAVAASLGWITLDVLLRAAAAEQPTDGLADDSSRRRFLRLAAGGSAAAIVAGATGRRLLTRLPQVPDISIAAPEHQGAILATGSDLAVPGITPIVVPNEDFYRIDTALVVPSVDETDWGLRVTGLVDREITLGYSDLLAMEQVEKYVTIACVSNDVGGDLVGNALWTGPRLTEVLDMAGVRSEASQLVARSVDGFTVGFPPDLAFDGREPLVALGMNGDPLPRPHGFPARLIVPGLYGYVSATKWLAEIELTTWDGFDAYWIPRGWAKEAPIKTQSRIDVPSPRTPIPAGSTTVAGVAWAPVRGIEKVEVRVDERPWIAAELSTPLAKTAWVQWRTLVDLAEGEHWIRVRATDGDGETQTGEIRSPRPDGATGHHEVLVRVNPPG